MIENGNGRPAHVFPQRCAQAVLGFALLLLGLYTLWSFLPALVWAVIFAIALWPLYVRLAGPIGTTRQKLVVPALLTLAVALLFLVPVGLTAAQLARESHTAMEWVRGAQQHGIPEPEILHRIPYANAEIDSWWRTNLSDPGSASELLARVVHGQVIDVSRHIGSEVLRRLTVFVFTLLTLFFLFREGFCVIEQMRRVSIRTFGPGGERVGQQIIASVHGTVDGLVLVGLGEGALMGVVYFFAGVPHPTVFGALTAIAAMIPFAAPVLFGVASLLLFSQDAILAGVIVFLVGMAVTATADHFIRPVLIGGATRLPFIWVLLGILGGVEVWGLLGLFLGPAILAALIMLWRDWASAPHGIIIP
jgi:predicted PurR-regulated permease PerM